MREAMTDEIRTGSGATSRPAYTTRNANAPLKRLKLAATNAFSHAAIMKRCAGPSRKRPSAKAKEKLILPQAAGEKKQFLFLSILRSEKTIREKVVPQGRLSASVFLFEGCIKSGL